MEGDLEFLIGIKKESYTLRRVAGEPSYTIVVYGPEGMLDDTKKTLEKFGFGLWLIFGKINFIFCEYGF